MLKKETATNPANAIIYRNNADMLRRFLTEIVQNIHELHKLGELPIFTEVEDIVVKEQQ